jgi:hypothetical protein
MLTELLQYLRNWFKKAEYSGVFTVENGQLKTEYSGGEISIANGQYFYIHGSALNDGVYQYPITVLLDETFSGSVWVLAVPPALIALADEITEWQTKYASSVVSPYQSESYSRGSYSRTKASAWQSAVSLKTAFADRLAPWRKL